MARGDAFYAEVFGGVACVGVLVSVSVQRGCFGMRGLGVGVRERGFGREGVGVLRWEGRGVSIRV